MLVRFRQDVGALKPAVFHIMADTNNVAQSNSLETPEEITNHIASMVEIAQPSGVQAVSRRSCQPASLVAPNPEARLTDPGPQRLAEGLIAATPGGVRRLNRCTRRPWG